MDIEERLEGLEKEKEIVEGLEYLSFDCRDTCLSWYNHEIQWCKDRLEERKA